MMLSVNEQEALDLRVESARLSNADKKRKWSFKQILKENEVISWRDQKTGNLKDLNDYRWPQ